MVSHQFSSIVFLLIFSVFTYPVKAQECGEILRTTQLKINDYSVTAELAVSDKEKSCGLSFRDFLAKDHGMLFVYFKDRFLTFWMKDTRIPLSIAFLDAEGVILNILDMEPMNTAPRYRSSGSARYALEMTTNWFSEHQVKAGDQVQFQVFESTN